MVVLVALALPLPAWAQEEPPAEPEPPVEIEIVIPEGPRTITLIVPPLPAKKQPPKATAAPKSAPTPAPRPTAEPAAPAPVAAAPESEPSYSPTPDAASEPAPTPPVAVKAKPKAKAKPVREPKRKVAAATAVRAVVTEPALPVAMVVGEQRSAAALPSYTPADGSSPPYLLALLALAGTLLLGVAGAAPRLALYWPDMFVPLTRERDTVSLFGLCLLVSGVLAWSIV